MLSNPGGLDELNHRRFQAVLKSLAELLQTYGHEKWANWFTSDLQDYQAAQDHPRRASRQLAVIEHVLTAFGGMQGFKQIVLEDAQGQPVAEDNERLQNLSTQLWSAGRGLQGHLMAELQGGGTE